ncbi:hypothetical protein [Aliiroseovarius sp. 2305UL8-7]|uniref:hypothetical protein n=1 Tax=Aliiroseovarius conchicola TaxID=3121637 RepID=UPI003528286E
MTKLMYGPALALSIAAFLGTVAVADTLTFPEATTDAACALTDGTWYKDTCWAGFEDETIPADEIDAVVEARLAALDELAITVDGVDYPVVDSRASVLGATSLLAVVVVEMPEGLRSFATSIDLSSDDVAPLSLIDGNAINVIFESQDTSSLEQMIIAQSTTVERAEMDNGVEIRAQYDVDGYENVVFPFDTDILSVGTSTLEIDGTKAILNGELGLRAYQQIKDLITNHPEVTTIVMGEVDGSVDDMVNVHTGRMIRKAGLSTEVLSDSLIASGGVDLFTAGVNRIVHKGAQIGIHSWCCFEGLTAIELPRDHPAHASQLDYYTLTLGPDVGPAFYFHTLEASPFDSVSFMSDEDIKSWTIATQFLPE